MSTRGQDQTIDGTPLPVSLLLGAPIPGTPTDSASCAYVPCWCIWRFFGCWCVSSLTRPLESEFDAHASKPPHIGLRSGRGGGVLSPDHNHSWKITPTESTRQESSESDEVRSAMIADATVFQRPRKNLDNSTMINKVSSTLRRRRTRLSGKPNRKESDERTDTRKPQRLSNLGGHCFFGSKYKRTARRTISEGVKDSFFASVSIFFQSSLGMSTFAAW